YAVDRRGFLATAPLMLGMSASPSVHAQATPSSEPRPWTDQTAYSIVRIEVRDGKAFGEYVAGHTPTIAAAGGSFLVAGARPQMVEGNWPNRLMVIHQWPNARTFLDWYDSAAYAPWKRLRHSASSAQVVLVQGVAAADAMPAEAPAFAVIDVEVRDGPAFGRYVQGHMPGLRTGGGVFLAAGGRHQVIEGDWTPRRIVMHRWPSSEAFRTWYESAEYRPWRDLRWSAASTDVGLATGLSAKVKAERGMP
ncbi:MAG: DUF1330 domain-containing protein, partial [Rubrivivax sp.]